MKKYLLFICLMTSILSQAQRGQRPGGQGSNSTKVLVGQIVEASSNSPMEFATVSIFS